MGSDDITKPERAPIQRSMADLLLQKLREKLVDAHDLLIVNELRNFLIEQQKQDIAIEELRSVVHTLQAGMIATIDQIQILQHAVLSLTQSRDEMLKRQDDLAKLCDDLAEHINSNRDRR